MRFSWERELLARNISKNAKLLGLVLATYANGDGAMIFPSVGRLRRDTGLGAHAFRKGMAELEECGMVAVTRRNFGTERRTNMYTLAWPGHESATEEIPPVENPPLENSTPEQPTKRTTHGENNPRGEQVYAPSADGTPQPASQEAKATPSPAYPDWFEELWKIYPRRDGGNPKKAALRAAKARLAAAADRHGEVAVMRAGIERYAEKLKVEGRLGTCYVKQAATFLGPDEHYREWAAKPAKPSYVEDWRAAADRVLNPTY